MVKVQAMEEGFGAAGAVPEGRRSRWAQLFAGLPLVVVVVAPAAASWLRLVEVGHGWLGLAGPLAVLVPLVFDAAALYVAALSWRSVLAGDSALVDRLLVWAYAIGSATLNIWYSESAPAAMFFGAASVSAVVLWDRTLRARRRDALREMGAIEQPLPRFRLLRWVVAPAETGRAWRLAVIEGLTSPAEALEFARRTAVVEATTSLPRAAVEPPEAGGADVIDADDDVKPAEIVAGGSDYEMQALNACETKREALLLAWDYLQVKGIPKTSDVMPAVEWLAERGVRIDKSGAYDVRRRLERKALLSRVQLTAVGGA